MSEKSISEPVKRHPRPISIDDYRRQAAGVYAANDWDHDEQIRHRSTLGVVPKRLEECTEDELRIILTDFEKDKMILYRD